MRTCGLILCAGILALGCGGRRSGGGSDDGGDADGFDVQFDTPFDTANDPGTDARTDTGFDTGTDRGFDIPSGDVGFDIPDVSTDGFIPDALPEFSGDLPGDLALDLGASCMSNRDCPPGNCCLVFVADSLGFCLPGAGSEAGTCGF